MNATPATATPTAATPTPTAAAPPTYEVVLSSEVQWEQLNPARGDKSPKAATLWGDRNGSGPTGFLLGPTDGFKSPPHIHNVSYRGVVIRGLIHNDDPKADELWMPTASFWTQPKGGVHITAAKGSSTLAYIEIDEGPYLVRPVAKAFQSEDKPLNVHASNLVWVDVSTKSPQASTTATAKSPKIAFLWGNPQDNQPSGSLAKLPGGFAGALQSHSSSLRAVVIQGRLEHGVPGQTDVKTLEPGSLFSSTGAAEHRVRCGATADCIIYLRVAGRFDFGPAQVKE